MKITIGLREKTMRTKEELKQLACEAVDRKRDELVAFYESVYSEPELGYKEVKTSAKFQKFLDDLGYDYKTGLAITGVRSDVKGRSSDFKVAVMGELDAILVRSHKDANPDTGAVHACGHAAQLASLAGVAAALQGSGVMEDLDGDIVLLATPAEEYIEMDYRNKLREEGRIDFLCGKAEMIREGVFDDIDASIMQHTTINSPEYKAGATSSNNGFVGKLVHYIGKEAHGGAAPWDGVNALNAAMLGLMAVHAQRETFKDEDHIRFHPIITKGGDTVNTVPADVRIESYVRGNSPSAIIEASEKIDRALKSGADAVGAQCEILTLSGDFPCVQCEDLNDIMFENMKTLVGDKAIKVCPGFGGGSSDQGDVSSLIPSIQSYFTGAAGGLHQESYRMTDVDNAVITAAKAMTMTAIDLLYDGAKLGKQVKANFDPYYKKDQYLKEWGHLD